MQRQPQRLRGRPVRGAGSPVALSDAPPSAPGLSGVVWALLASAVLVPLGVLAIGAWLAWGEAWRQAESELARTADAAAEYAARVLDGHLLLAKRVDDLLKDLPDSAIRDNEARLHSAMQRMAATRPSVLTLYAIDARGRPLVSANMFPVPRDASLEDRDFFTALRGPDAPAVFVSKVHVGRFDGQLFFSVAQRHGSSVKSGDLPGETAFRGVVLASLRPNELAARLRQPAGERSDRLALVRTDGELLARTREFESPPQTLGADSPMRPIMEAGTDRTVVRGRSGVDGLERVAAYKRVEGWPVYTLVARP